MVDLAQKNRGSDHGVWIWSRAEERNDSVVLQLGEECTVNSGLEAAAN